MRFNASLRGKNAMILRFFENGDAAEVGIREEEAGIRAWFAASEAAALFGENGANSWADHGVAHAHDVDARNALANVGMDALEVAENGFLPIVPIFIEQELTILRGSAFGESPIKRPDGAVDMRAEALMRGVDVAERRASQRKRCPRLAPRRGSREGVRA